MMEDLDAIPYQSPEWCEAICADGRFRDISRHYEFEDGCRIVVPLVTVITLGPARFTAASYPDGCGMGGAICCGNTTARHLRHVLKDLMASNVFSIKIRPNPMQGRRWAEAASGLALTTRARRAHVIDLKEGFDHVYNKLFTRDTRSGIRKAERKGVVVRNSSNGDLIPVLHGLLARSVERWAAQQREPLWLARFRFRRRDPIEKLYRIQEAFGSDCKVWAAWVDGTPVAASLVLTGRHVNDSRGALDRAALGTSCANDLLQKLTIEEACQSGCRFYHLGESGNSASLAHFKERFGATAYHYDEILIEQFPLFRIEQSLKGGVKKVIGFKD
ncbi:hypothetical protein NN6n1_45450 [Shinella zoogloeoides]